MSLIFHSLVYSKLAGFELHFELRTIGDERLADILEDVLDSSSEVFESSEFASLTKFLLWMSNASPAKLFILSNKVT